MTLVIGEDDAPNFGVGRKRRKRMLTLVQMFSKHYYTSLVKPTVEVKLLALGKERVVSRGERISLRSAETDLAWSNASEEVKAEIQRLHRCQKKSDAKSDDSDDSSDDDDKDDDEDKKTACQGTPEAQHLTGKELEKWVFYYLSSIY